MAKQPWCVPLTEFMLKQVAEAAGLRLTDLDLRVDLSLGEGMWMIDDTDLVVGDMRLELTGRRILFPDELGGWPPSQPAPGS